MYSKKINQLATNLTPQNDDLLPIGDAETGQLKTTTFGSVSGITGDGVISGGIVTWTGTGLNFNISACTYILNGVRYTSPFTTKTLAAADPTNPRIDVFAVNTSGQVEVIQGTPNANPVEPEGDTPTTLGLTNVTINAGSTTPDGVTRDLIYDENVESWTKNYYISGTVNYADTAFAYTGSKSILITMNAGFAYLYFSKATAMDISNYKSLSFAIRLNAAWTSNTILAVRFYNGSNTVSNSFQINATNNVGFNRNLAGQWQLITIPFNNTNLRFTNNLFTEVRIQTTNAAATYRLDTIQLNNGIGNPGGTTIPSNSFGFVNGSTGTASATSATDTLNVVGTGLATTSATGKTLTIAVPSPIPSQTGNNGKYLTTDGSTLSWGTVSGGSMSIGGTVTSGTTGSVLFVGASSALAQDNANFFWDDTNNLLGIGTATPSSPIEIYSTSTTYRGIAATQASIDTVGAVFTGRKIRGTSAVANGDFLFNFNAQGYDGSAYQSGSVIRWQVDGTVSAGSVPTAIEFRTGSSGTGTQRLLISSSGNTTFNGSSFTNRFTSSGRLLLGTTTESTFILDVNGTARVTGSTIITGSTTASGAIARGMNLTPTLVAAANNDVLVGLDINPTFTLGAFTGTYPYTAFFSRSDSTTQVTRIGIGNSQNTPIASGEVSRIEFRNGRNQNSGIVTARISHLNIFGASFPENGALDFYAHSSIRSARFAYNGNTFDLASTFSANITQTSGGFYQGTLGTNTGFSFSGSGSTEHLFRFTSYWAETVGNSTQFARWYNTSTASYAMTLYGTNNLGVGTTSDAGFKLDVNGTFRTTQLNVSALNTAPATASSTGTLGEIRITADYIYICTATNTWKRVAIATF